jgi:hypothetical protein
LIAILYAADKPEILKVGNESKTAGNAGMQAKLHCRAAGAPVIRFSWKREGSNITSVSEKYIVEERQVNNLYNKFCYYYFVHTIRSSDIYTSYYIRVYLYIYNRSVIISEVVYKFRFVVHKIYNHVRNATSWQQMIGHHIIFYLSLSSRPFLDNTNVEIKQTTGLFSLGFEILTS